MPRRSTFNLGIQTILDLPLQQNGNGGFASELRSLGQKPQLKPQYRELTMIAKMWLNPDFIFEPFAFQYKESAIINR